ncbi:helix-turn-helix domain-containing protein [Shewanella dokdonensis]|uniref:Helix-turn-helix domain-containing protein n=1 Tax=Shewanella dokdonensis TaxID=712036 RepID=A0ABX8DDD7_9GAMM|nr:helix-turn-helix domain-containing protein [Shewanella dokdonensis]MCL1074540.1 helix-turn-helix domain-containing protein [Shewanella dokdonensis]QVK22430.1 helix-turn-helix domain-containing protein [Shewanella dokdonensis]
MQLGNYWYAAQQGELRSLAGNECQRLRLAERRLLNALLQHREQVVSRYQLMQSLGSTNEQLLVRGIVRLQQKLGDPQGHLLERVATEGYILHQQLQPRLNSGGFGGLRISWQHYGAIIAMALLVMTMLWQLPRETPDWWSHHPSDTPALAQSVKHSAHPACCCQCRNTLLRHSCTCHETHNVC